MLSSKIISSIGGMCYITYLIHYPMMHLIFKLTNSWSPGLGATVDFLFVTCIWLPVILIVCAVAFVVVERPFMSHDWPRRLGQRLVRSFAKSAPREKWSVYIGNALESYRVAPTSADIAPILLRCEGHAVIVASTRFNICLRLFEMLWVMLLESLTPSLMNLSASIIACEKGT